VPATGAQREHEAASWSWPWVVDGLRSLQAGTAGEGRSLPTHRRSASTPAV